MKIGTTKTFWDLIDNNDKRVVILEGGSRSGKTWAICQYLAQLALQSREPLRIVVARQYFSWIRSTVLPEFQEVLESFKVWNPQSLNKQEWTYTLNGSIFYFIGSDKNGDKKVHGFQSSYVWINEAVECHYPFVKQLIMRMERQMIIDFNPNCSAEHWIYTKMSTRKDSVLLHSMFKDNHFLSKDIIAEIAGYEPTDENVARGTADLMMWQIYGLGERGVVTGLVFPCYDIVDEESWPLSWDSQAYGLDFGYSNDPSAMCHVGIIGGDLYVREILYAKGLTILANPSNGDGSSIQEKMEAAVVSKSVRIYADSVEPRSIAELCSAGYKCEPVVKQKIVKSIELVKRYRIKVHCDSYNLVRELKNYKWKQKQDGSLDNEVVGGMDHLIDAMRYAVISLSQSQGKTMIDSGRMDYGVSKYDY